MFKNVIELLKYAKIGESELIDIAKGKYKAPENIKELKKQIVWRLKR